MSSLAPELISENGQVTPDPKAVAAAASKPPTTGITTVRSADQLNNIATSEVNADIAGQVAPLQSQYDTLGTQEDRTRQNLSDMFGTLQPFVAGAAQNVQAAYNEAEVHQQGIFSAAQNQLAQLKQSRAQEAQALAQEMGGPVALSEFTAGMDEAQGQLANLGAGQMLHTLGYAQAGTQEAQAWAGKVFPLIQTEEQSKARNYYEDQKKEIQKQIASLKGQATSKIQARKNELLVQEREYALQKTQQALDKIKAQHDWQATKRTLRNDDARLKLAQQQSGLDVAGVTGTYKGKPTLAAKQLTAQEKQQAAALGLSTKEYQLRKAQLDKSSKNADKRLAVATTQSYGQWLDAAINPQAGRTVKQSQAVPVDKTAAITGKVKDAYADPGSPTGYSRLVTTYTTPTTAAITNPNSLVDYLLSHNVPKQIAVRMVKARLHIPNWSYGKPDPRAPKPSGRSGPPAPGKSEPGPFNPYTQ